MNDELMMKKIKPNACYSAHEVADRADLPADVVNQLLSSGKYGGYSICGQWFTTGIYIDIMKNEVDIMKNEVDLMEFEGDV